MTWREKKHERTNWEEIYETIHIMTYMNGAAQWKMNEYGENNVHEDEIT